MRVDVYSNDNALLFTTGESDSATPGRRSDGLSQVLELLQRRAERSVQKELTNRSVLRHVGDEDDGDDDDSTTGGRAKKKKAGTRDPGLIGRELLSTTSGHAGGWLKLHSGT